MGLKRITNRKKLDIKKDIRLSFIQDLTPTQVETYIDNNVTDLASAKEFLKKLSKVVLYLTRQ